MEERIKGLMELKAYHAMQMDDDDPYQVLQHMYYIDIIDELITFIDGTTTD
jgi:hypothetical protein